MLCTVVGLRQIARDVGIIPTSRAIWCTVRRDPGAASWLMGISSTTPTFSTVRTQWRSQRGGLGGSTPPPFALKPFFHSHKVTVIKHYNVSLTTRRTINSHNFRKTNHLGGSAIASMVECVLTWIREQYLVVCNIAKWTILCIAVHFQPVIKLLQKGVRVHHRRVILMQKMQNFSGEGTAPPQTPPPVGRGHPLPTPLGASILTPPILKFCLCYWSSLMRWFFWADVSEKSATSFVPKFS